MYKVSYFYHKMHITLSFLLICYTIMSAKGCTVLGFNMGCSRWSQSFETLSTWPSSIACSSANDSLSSIWSVTAWWYMYLLNSVLNSSIFFDVHWAIKSSPWDSYSLIPTLKYYPQGRWGMHEPPTFTSLQFFTWKDFFFDIQCQTTYAFLLPQTKVEESACPWQVIWWGTWFEGPTYVVPWFVWQFLKNWFIIDLLKICATGAQNPKTHTTGVPKYGNTYNRCTVMQEHVQQVYWNPETHTTGIPKERKNQTQLEDNKSQVEHTTANQITGGPANDHECSDALVMLAKHDYGHRRATSLTAGEVQALSRSWVCSPKTIWLLATVVALL